MSKTEKLYRQIEELEEELTKLNLAVAETHTDWDHVDDNLFEIKSFLEKGLVMLKREFNKLHGYDIKVAG